MDKKNGVKWPFSRGRGTKKKTPTPLSWGAPIAHWLDLSNEVHNVSELSLVPKWPAVKVGRAEKTSLLETGHPNLWLGYVLGHNFWTWEETYNTSNTNNTGVQSGNIKSSNVNQSHLRQIFGRWRLLERQFHGQKWTFLRHYFGTMGPDSFWPKNPLDFREHPLFLAFLTLSHLGLLPSSISSLAQFFWSSVLG